MAQENGDNDALMQLVKRVATISGALVVFSTALGMLNKWVIADPITRAMTEERVARQVADSSIVKQLSAIEMREMVLKDHEARISALEIMAIDRKIEDAASRDKKARR